MITELSKDCYSNVSGIWVPGIQLTTVNQKNNRGQKHDFVRKKNYVDSVSPVLSEVCCAALAFCKSAPVSSLINTCLATHLVGQSLGDFSATKLTASPVKK